MKKLYSIGETSKINSVSVQALRLYERMGLLKPAYINKENGYRYYKEEQFLYIDIIKYSNYIKIPLKNLIPLFESNNPIEIRKILLEQSKKITKEINYLTRVKNDIKSISTRIEELAKTDVLTVTTTYQDEIYIATHPVKDDEPFKEIDNEMRRVEMDLFKHKVDFGSFSGCIYDENFNSKEAFISLEKKEDGFKCIEEGDYLAIAFNIKDLELAQTILKDYIKDNHIKVTGPYYLIQHISMSFCYLFDLMIKKG